MTRSLKFSPGEFYHIYNRGTDKRKIFLSRTDYLRFIALLYLSNSANPLRIDLRRKSLSEIFEADRGETIVEIGSYCLMPNHFHLLIREKTENGISLFMQKLTTAYTMYFNKKNERSGALFQGTFRAEHLSTDNYLKYIFAYIHLNPIKLIDSKWKESGIGNINEAKDFLINYSYSSYLEYIRKERSEKIILNRENFPDYFTEAEDFQKMLDFWLEYKN